MTESEFRALAQQIYQQVERAFDDIDPDQIECEVAQGALTLMLANGRRWILSCQPAVCQLWLAIASRGKAHHFDYDDDNKRWLDNKNPEIELLSYLKQLVSEETSLQLNL